MIRLCISRAGALVGPACLVAVTLFTAATAAEVRTWTDKSGRFRIEAEFVAEEDGTVTLRKADGEEVEVPLDKLSAADQKAVQEAKEAGEENPFQSKGSREASPFASKGKPSTGKGNEKRAGASPRRPAGKERDDGDGRAAGPREVTVDWSAAESVPPAGGDGWTVEIGAPVKGPARPKTTALPGKSNFFEAMQPLAISGDGKHAAVGYLLGEPKPEGTCRIALCDLETGRAAPVAVTTGQFAPLAIHDDGQHVLMRREEFGFGNHDRLEVWRVAGGKVRKLSSIIPYKDASGGNRDVAWARFLADDSLAMFGNGELSVWRFPELEPTHRLPASGVPALSPDRRFIAWCDGNNVGLYDTHEAEIVAQQATPTRLHNPQLAFSPSGKRLACIAQQKLLVWDVATGTLLQDMDVPTIHIFTGIAYPHDDWVLGGNQFLIGATNQVLLWTYSGQQQVATHGPWTLFGTVDGEKSGALLPLKIPHAAAETLLEKASTDPNLFILRAGTKVAIDVAGVSDPAERDRALQGLVKRIEAMGGVPDPAGRIRLVASVTGPTQKTLSLRNAGDYQVQEYVTGLQLVHEGKPVWQTSTTNVPGGPVIFFNLEEGENIGTWLKKHEKPNYELFQTVQLPRFLQRPSATAGPSGSLTLGTSQVTAAGLR